MLGIDVLSTDDELLKFGDSQKAWSPYTDRK